MRCDGNQPSCGPCLTKGVECEYQIKENKRKPPSKRYVESLQARIHVLEERLASLDRDSPLQRDRQLHYSSSSVDRSSDETNGSPNACYEGNEDETSVSEEETFISDITDTCGRLNLDEDGQLRFFGSQSNYHLLHNHINNQNTAGQHVFGAPTARISRHVSVALDLQEHLLGLYFRWQNPWVYLVDKDACMRDYRSGNRSRYCTPLLLLSIFSVAARFSDRLDVRSDPRDPFTAGNIYAEHAKALVTQELDAVRITTVQSVALLSIRWMAENKEPAGWLFAGMATRMAFNLGLNLDCDKMVASGLLTQEEADVRKVVWWGCYSLDKNFSLGLGRPGSTSDRDITCAKPRHCTVAEFEPWLPSNEHDLHTIGLHSRVASTAHHVCEHMALATEALDIIYAPNSQLTKAEIATIVSEADVAMNAFWTALPSYLRLPSTPNIPSLPHVYQLHLQYHVGQILLHRPLISHARSKLKSCTSLHSSDDTDIHLKVCRASASEVTKLLQLHKKHYSMRLVSIGTVCHTFAAATIHLMDAKSRDPLVQQQGLTKLHICMSALHEMRITWQWSYRAFRAIQTLANVWLTPSPKSAAPSTESTAAQVADADPTIGKSQGLSRWSPQLEANRSDLAAFTGNFDPSMYLPNSPSGSPSSCGPPVRIEEFDWLFNKDDPNLGDLHPDVDYSDIWSWNNFL